MKPHAVIVGLVVASTVSAAAVAVALTGGTGASYAATSASTPTSLGAASVRIGDGGRGPDLVFRGLGPGRPQTVALAVQYVGSIPADLSLSVAPGPDPALCEKSASTWEARPGAALTLAVGSAAPVPYCSLYGGAPQLLVRAAPPGSTTVVPVTLTLGPDAAPSALGLAQHDVAVVHADGGFTDHADGRLDLTTADPEPGPPTGGPVTPDLATPPATVATVPPVAAGAAATEAPVAIPAECAAAGMSAADFAEVVTVDPARHTWSAPAQPGSGPFLVLGTSGDDTIVGSGRADCIVGGGGDDTLSGGGGDDVIVGGSGADTLIGGAGDDRLYGDAGVDDLRGGEGADVLDGGADGATCDTTPADLTTGCLPAPTTAPTTAPAPAPTSSVPAAPDTVTPTATSTATPTAPSTTVEPSTAPAATG